MKKNKEVKPTETTTDNKIVTNSIIEQQIVKKENRVKELLLQYHSLEKKSLIEGRQIRRKLRRYGYYLSKINKMHRTKTKEIKKDTK